MSDYKRLDDSGLSALVTGYFTKIKDKLEDLGGLSNDAVATVEEETASKNYTTGDYFIKNDKLNVVKQNTTADTTWIKDENYEETSISEELNSINQKIDEIPRPSGTKQVTISQNGTTTEDVEDYENAQITVNVPGPSGKITISQNGTDIDVSSYALADINVSGGASNEDALIERSISIYENDRVAKVGQYAFYYNSILEEVSFQNATSIESSAFAQCSNLSKANFPLATSIGTNCFYYCRDLTEINIPLVTSLGTYAFQYCDSLTEVNCQLITSIGNYTFATCSNLSEVDFPLVTTIGSSAFNSCYNLTEVKFPLVTSIGNYAFSTCTYLTKADFPLLTSIGTGAFQKSINLTSLILRNTDRVCTLQSTNAFTNTPIADYDGYIYVPAALKSQYEDATNWDTFAAQFRALEDYTVDGTTTGDLDPTKI